MKHVIIGASVAGLAAAEEIRRLDPRAEIVVISREEKVVSRCMLHKRLGLERSTEAINFVEDDFFEKNSIMWMKGREVEALLEDEYKVKLDPYEEGDETVSFDKLLIASGASYFVPPIRNLKYADNVFGFRDLSDIAEIERAIEKYGSKVAIIGGGLVGVDVACGLCARKLDVTVIEMEQRLMPLQLDEYVSDKYKRAFEEKGCKILLGRQVKTAETDQWECVRRLVFSNGESVQCDVVIVAVSVKPQMDFLNGSSIQALHMNYYSQNILSRFLKKTDISVDKGLKVDAYLMTSLRDIYGAGDVTGISSIWPDARAMGICAARNMCGRAEPYKDLFPDKNSAVFWGIKSVSLGKINVNPESYEILVHRTEKSYKKIILKEGYLEGVLMEGDISNAGVYLYALRERVPVAGLLDHIFRLSFADFYGADPITGAYIYKSLKN